MTVFILSRVHVENYREVEGVFDSYEKADMFAKRIGLNDSWADWWAIEEYSVQ